jgi:hypothetical protein
MEKYIVAVDRLHEIMESFAVSTCGDVSNVLQVCGKAR